MVVGSDGPSKVEDAALQSLVGEWAGSASAYLAPGMPPESSGARQQVRRIGDFWVAEHATSEAFGEPFEHMYLIGLDGEGGLTGTLVTGTDREAWPLTGSYEKRTGEFELLHQLRTAQGVVVDARTVISVDQRKGEKLLQVFQLFEGGFGALYLEMETTRRR